MPSIIVGLVSIALGLWGLSAWWWSVVETLRGLMPLLLVLLGLTALGAGVTSLRDVGGRRTVENEELSDEKDE
ncbi:MAG: hypothetical protein HQL51_03655 [Magnetococcales bacterium]|nr:hypothetical protein [Magnetococcales bacterium]